MQLRNIYSCYLACFLSLRKTHKNTTKSIAKSKDFIDEILNLDDDLDEALKFEKLLADDILIKQEPEEVSMESVRDRQKKDNHNMSELNPLLVFITSLSSFFGDFT